MRYLLIFLSLLLFPLPPAQSDVSVGIGIRAPGVRIGINLPAYPRLVRVPGHPVYYDPGLDWNYFFYDGLYWVFHDDDWFVSSWYNGPWDRVDRYDVPVFILRIPVRYYRHPPPYFRPWHYDAPPRWGERWGRDWQQRRDGWERRERHAIPPPAPLPTYQRRYSGDRYPGAIEQQHTIRNQRYRYQPRDPMAQRYYQRERQQNGPQGDGRGNRQDDRGHR